MSDIQITPMKPGEREEAAELCASAFIQTPFTVAASGGDGKKQKKFLVIGMNMLLKAPGRVFVARDDAEIVGVMRIVKWPDCQKAMPRGLAKLPGLIFGGKGFRNVLHFRGIWEQHDPKEPHWHLDPLCVLPGRQGQGIGSKLLAHYTGIVDESGMLAYHETDQEQNERLYNRFGFETKETEMIFGIKNFFMRRERRSQD